jgi:phage protein D
VRGVEVLTVEGVARHVGMHQAGRSRVFRGMTRAQVMRAVAAEHGYQGRFAQIADTDEVFETLHQVAETDGHFLRRLATAEDFTFTLDGDRLVIGPASTLVEPVRVLAWRPGASVGDVLSLNVESNLALAVAQVELRGRDPREKKTVVATAQRTPEEKNTFERWFDRIDAETGRTRVEHQAAVTVARPTTVASPRSVERKAYAHLRALDADAVKLTARIVGDPTLRTRQVVELTGASRRLSGRYLVRTVRHQLATDGYTCDLTLRRLVGAQGAAMRTGPARPPSGATSATVTGASRAPVPIDLVDPETGRLTTSQTGTRAGS